MKKNVKCKKKLAFVVCAAVLAASVICGPVSFAAGWKKIPCDEVRGGWVYTPCSDDDPEKIQSCTETANLLLALDSWLQNHAHDSHMFGRFMLPTNEVIFVRALPVLSPPNLWPNPNAPAFVPRRPLQQPVRQNFSRRNVSRRLFAFMRHNQLPNAAQPFNNLAPNSLGTQPRPVSPWYWFEFFTQDSLWLAGSGAASYCQTESVGTYQSALLTTDFWCVSYSEHGHGNSPTDYHMLSGLLIHFRPHYEQHAWRYDQYGNVIDYTWRQN